MLIVELLKSVKHVKLFSGLFAFCVEKCSGRGQGALQGVTLNFIKEHLSQSTQTDILKNAKNQAILEVLVQSKGILIQKVVDFCK